MNYFNILKNKLLIGAACLALGGGNISCQGGSSGGGGGGNGPTPNNAPVLTITKPLDNSSYKRSETIDLEASVYDQDGDNVPSTGWDPVDELSFDGLEGLVGNYIIPLDSTLGSYVLCAYGFDEHNAEGESCVTVNVENNLPVADLSKIINLTPKCGEMLPYDFTASYDIEDGSILTYHVNWGDGNEQNVAGGFTAKTYTCDFAGNILELRLTVTDLDGDTNSNWTPITPQP